MCFMVAVLTVLLSFSVSAHADVRMAGEMVIQDTSVGPKYLGEVINDTDGAITRVRIIITARDGGGNIIDSAEGFVNGYNAPDGFSDSYIPPGGTVPFDVYGDGDAADIASCTYTISYEQTVTLDIHAVDVDGELNIIPGILGAYFYGEVVNNSSTCIYYVYVNIAIKDSDGHIIDIDFTSVKGSNYLASDRYHTESLLRPGESAPFELVTFTDYEDVASYYPIVTYSVTSQTSYEYFGEDMVLLQGEINKLESYGDARYWGEAINGTNRDIYSTKVTIISRDDSGAIIDISYSYVDGTSYEISEGVTSDSHIAPGSSASFDVDSSAPFADVASYECRIYYEYADEPEGIEEAQPIPFALHGNYPNPFNPSTTIAFSLAENAFVSLIVYNTLGQKIEELINEHLDAGEYTIQWDASQYTSGTYLYVLTSDSRKETGRMTLIK